MLNISHNKLNKKVDISGYKASQKVFRVKDYGHFNRFLLAFSIMAILVLFLPWTQNITSKGYLTTLTPDQRPQTIQSPIPGKIEKWFVREGDYVEKGDTILYISEIKNDYFDPKLLERTGMQLEAKSRAVVSYQEKVKALNTQIRALTLERKLKLEQAANKLMQTRLKVKSDSIDLEAAQTNLMIAQRQYDRIEQLKNEGLKAMTDLEEKRLKLQETKRNSYPRKISYWRAEMTLSTQRLNSIGFRLPIPIRSPRLKVICSPHSPTSLTVKHK